MGTTNVENDNLNHVINRKCQQLIVDFKRGGFKLITIENMKKLYE